jgi:hypothetical protein
MKVDVALESGCGRKIQRSETELGSNTVHSNGVVTVGWTTSLDLSEIGFLSPRSLAAIGGSDF